ncbi:hypothetical protein [Paenibacillus sp. RU26A]|uniref:hypothetical protein n=1 Tax=Paenibacillus sp. RU26A TaxID=1907393 RepID=UPI00117D38B4|nr:hypothetical protein [Paenibacillus sp. RU26A]
MQIEVQVFLEYNSPLSAFLKGKHCDIAQRFITKRLFLFERACPYRVTYVNFEKETQAGVAKLGKRIEVSEDLPQLMKFETIMHEWAHQILHLRSNAILKDHITKEIEAESVSFIVGYILGVINEISHIYIAEKLAVEQDKLQRLRLYQSISKLSDKRIVRASLTILKKLAYEHRQIQHHIKNGGKNI